MKKTEMERLERLSAQLDGMHREIIAITRKSGTDAVNAFKLKFVNAVLAEANQILGKRYKPLADFDQFDSEALPSNSDVTFILAQYIEAADMLRSDSIEIIHGSWSYRLTDTDERFRTRPPASLSRKR